MSPVRVTFLLCMAEILGLSSLATFASLLPFFLETWKLSHTQAGWLSAVYYAGYVLCVPLLTSMTDRHDAKRILMGSLILGVVSSLGFSIAASGFWSAMLMRFLSGVSLAGIYMPGLKLLSDHVQGERQTRYLSFYTASFSFGAGLSFFITGEINLLFGWQWAFAAAGLQNLAGAVVVWLWAPSGQHADGEDLQGHKNRVAAVFTNRQAMGYILAYAAHMWELFSLRSWMVAFLVYSRQLQPSLSTFLSPTQVVALINIIGLPASVVGNELCRRFGRKKTVTRIMLASFALSLVVGFTASLPYGVVVALGLVYGIFVLGDSASLIAGAVIHSPAESRGATLAVHSTIGFGAAFLGPLGVGVMLDLFSGMPGVGWGVAFAVMGGGCALGPFMLSRLLPKSSSSDSSRPIQ